MFIQISKRRHVHIKFQRYISLSFRSFPSLSMKPGTSLSLLSFSKTGSFRVSLDAVIKRDTYLLQLKSQRNTVHLQNNTFMAVIKMDARLKNEITIMNGI